MGHLLYLMFRCDFDVMENLENLEEFGDLNTRIEKLPFQSMNVNAALGFLVVPVINISPKCQYGVLLRLINKTTWKNLACI